MTPIVSYLSGLVTAFTPCVIVLMPIMLYRFFSREKKHWKLFFFFIIGFLIFYFILAYLIASIFTSEIQNGFKLGLGILFVVLGTLSFMERLNPLNLPLINNPFILGIIFAIIAASNPCALPYFSVVIANSKSAMIIINIMMFSLGIITPSIVFGLIGQKIIGVIKSSGKVFHSINKIMSLILIVSGGYIALNIKKIGKNDIYVVGGMLLLTFFILIKVFFIINNKKEILKLKNVLLLISLLLIIFVAIYNCNNILVAKNIGENVTHINNVCSADDILSCQICTRCIIIFGIAALIGFLGLFFIDRYRK